MTLLAILNAAKASGVTFTMDEAGRLTFDGPAAAVEPIRAMYAEYVADLTLVIGAQCNPKPAPVISQECGACIFLMVELEETGARRRFCIRCAKGHEPLQLGYQGSRLLVAPSECEEWTPGEQIPQSLLN